MRRLYFTVDVDPDVNIQIPGRPGAGSIDRGQGTEPRFGSSEEGLSLILEVLDRVGMKGTFFIEGRTAEMMDCSIASGHCIGIHGYLHEDLTQLGPDDVADVMQRSYAAVSDRVGRPTCFRAPYMQCNEGILDIMHRETGISDDSSFYDAIQGDSRPYCIGAVREFPMTRSRDSAGKEIRGYLWPMHEGRRSPADYLYVAENCVGDISIADHSWHPVESREGGRMDDTGRSRQCEMLTEVLSGILDMGFSPSIIGRGPFAYAHA